MLIQHIIGAVLIWTIVPACPFVALWLNNRDCDRAREAASKNA